jgi:hypothetical protein
VWRRKPRLVRAVNSCGLPSIPVVDDGDRAVHLRPCKYGGFATVVVAGGSYPTNPLGEHEYFVQIVDVYDFDVCR